MRVLVAMLVAVLLGVGGGVVTAVLTSTGSHHPAASTDPLGLDVPEQNLACSSQTYVRIVALGDNVSTLAAGVSENRGDPQLHYLDVADSCPTVWVDPGKGTSPDYVAYVGPYSGPSAPCVDRMQTVGSTVAHVTADSTNLVKCVCILGPSVAPELAPDDPDPTDDRTTIYIRSLQAMLVDLGLNFLTQAQETGRYDDATVAAVTRLQRDAGKPRTGTMDQATWKIFLGRACSRYDY